MRILVCGAGIAGLAAANRLSALGNEVTLVERAPGPRPQGYMIDFFGPGYDAAEAMGALPAIKEAAYPISEAILLDAQGKRRSDIQFGQFARTVGGRLLSLLRPDLERALRTSLPAEVELRYDSGTVAVEDDGDRVAATLSDGSVLEADLLVGADGIHSTVRRLVFGDESRFLRYLGFHTAAFLFRSPEIHAVADGRFCLTDTVGRQMGFYGLRAGTVAAFAVHRTPDPALPGDLRESLLDTYGSLGWMVPEALRHCPPSGEIYYDQVAQIEMPAWSKGRVTLVGDAAYAVSLLAGQGASLGIAGAYVLAEQLNRASSIAGGLAEYERLWRPVAAGKQQLARNGARWFLPGSKPQLCLRRLALKLARLPGIDRVVAGSLTGKSTALITNLHHSAREGARP
ncbi:FAD-dependent monooxygenase [Amycolatopsis dendrobii]|uniref:FAD-dependent monooxygenase n=1 Tax=Amycolatopsis dendrobii TaxID=2760662 RepID=A0A7W3ZB39_9PSEU|nr:FAD-dependent monooxygenase [Amycolatopsis dendrobii]MBB1154363.1 FAD-dependent monooxygenase [Amycolatopsis dendrobii]